MLCSLVKIYPKCRCIYGFVKNFWMGRFFERLRKVCGGSNLSANNNEASPAAIWCICFANMMLLHFVSQWCDVCHKMCRKAHIIREANIIRRSRHHLPKANIIEKSSFFRTSFFLWRVSDLDAKPCVADLDAHWFCRGYNNPLAMMGVALDRYLPERNAMLATRPM